MLSSKVVARSHAGSTLPPASTTTRKAAPMSSHPALTTRGLAPVALAAAAAGAVSVALALAAPASDAAAEEPPVEPPVEPVTPYEVWAVDQGEGLDRIHVYDADLDEVEVVDFSAQGHEVTTPHMIAFDSEHRYAVVAATTSGTVSIVRTADYEVVETIETGAGAHMASFTPDDASIWVANIGAATFTEITADLDEEAFALGRELDVTDDPAWQAEFAGVEGGGGGGAADIPAPVCHEYTADGRYAYLTLGPAEGGLVVVDIAADDPAIVAAFPRDEVRANCGLARSADGERMYANWGDPGDPDRDAEQTGAWYAFDTATHELLAATDETRGVDAHGVRLHPAGTELWQVNRGTDDGIVIDAPTGEIVDDIGFTGDSPDILDFAPDGERAFVSLRGPNPRSGAAHVATGETPGFAVLDVATREKVDLVQPAAGDDDELAASDFHGLGVRVTEPARRLAGADRVATAVAVSRDGFDDGAAEGVVLARADAFPDALAGVPLAAQAGGPLLLTDPGALADITAEEIARVLPTGATVHLLGGPAALSDEVAEAVEGLGYETARHAGADRFETALAIAEALDAPSGYLLASGEDVPDAVSAGAAAARLGAAVLLTSADGAPEAVDERLAGSDVPVWAIGGPAAAAHPDAEALVGEDRIATSVEVATSLFDDPAFIGLARADAFPDALSGGPHAAARGGPVLLAPSTALDERVADVVCDAPAPGDRVVGYGGVAALSADVLRGATARVHGAGC